MDVLLKGIAELEFDHPQLEEKVNQREFSIWLNTQLNRTRETKRKRYEFLSLGPKCEAAKEQDRQEIMKSYKDSLMESSSSMKNPKTVQFDIPNTDIATQEEPKVVDDSPPLIPTIIVEENPFQSSFTTKTPSASPTKTPSSSLTKTPPPSLTKTPPPSPIQTPIPLPTKTPIPWLTKNPISSSTKHLSQPRPKFYEWKQTSLNIQLILKI